MANGRRSIQWVGRRFDPARAPSLRHDHALKSIRSVRSQGGAPVERGEEAFTAPRTGDAKLVIVWAKPDTRKSSAPARPTRTPQGIVSGGRDARRRRASPPPQVRPCGDQPASSSATS